MPPILATLVYAILIAGLFVLNREPKTRTSGALWIPVTWFLIVGSREISLWLAGFGYGQYTNVETPEQYLEGSPIDRAVYMLLLLLGVAVLVNRGQKTLELLRVNIPIVVFFLYCGLSATWSDYPGVSMKRWIKALGDLVMVMIVLTDVSRVGAIKRLLSRVGFLLIPVSILLIKYYPDLGESYNFHHWTRVLVGVTTHKNYLGVICLMFGLASEWRLLDAYLSPRGRQRTGQLVAHGVLVTMVLWLLLSANSLTALACFVMAGSLLAATRFSFVLRRPAAVHILVAGVVVGSVSTLFLGLGGSALESMGRDASLTGRTGIWDLTLSLSGNPLVGTGFETFWLGNRLAKIWDVMPGIQEAHNGYLETFLNLGWIGVALLAVLIVAGYKNVLAVFRSNPAVGGLGLAYFVVGVVYNFTEAGFRMLNPIWSLFLLSITTIPRSWIAVAKKRHHESREMFSNEAAPLTQLEVAVPQTSYHSRHLH